MLSVFEVIQLPEIGFSHSKAHRFQAQAFLQGDLAIANGVGRVEYDWLFNDDKVHQVWGLGVPALHAIGALFWKCFSNSPYPDRLTFLLMWSATLGCISYSQLKDIVNAPILKNEAIASAGVHILTIGISPFLLCLVSTPLFVYEETIAFGILASFLQVALLCIIAKPKQESLEASLAGAILALVLFVSIQIRPTCIFYVVSTIAVLFLLASQRRSFKILFTCASLALLSFALLLLTNRIRFGSVLEFGHSLNLQDMAGSMYLTRFKNLYIATPFIDRLKELFGQMFFLNSERHGDYYTATVASFQSNGMRWREFSFSTFPSITSIIIAFGVVSRFLELPRRSFRSLVKWSCEEWLLIWLAISGLMLILFYSSTPVISGRYIYDFVPCISAGLIIATQALPRQFKKYAMLGVAGYSFYTLSVFRTNSGHLRPLGIADIMVEEGPDFVNKHRTPYLDHNPLRFDNNAMPSFHLFGWNQTNFDCKRVVTIVTPEIARVRLQIADSREQERTKPPRIEAKYDLCWLKIESDENNAGKRVIEFSVPCRGARKTWHSLFLGIEDWDPITDSNLRGIKLYSIEYMVPDQTRGKKEWTRL